MKKVPKVLKVLKKIKQGMIHYNRDRCQDIFFLFSVTDRKVRGVFQLIQKINKKKMFGDSDIGFLLQILKEASL